MQSKATPRPSSPLRERAATSGASHRTTLARGVAATVQEAVASPRRYGKARAPRHEAFNPAVEAAVRAILIRQDACQYLAPEDVAELAQQLRLQIKPFATWLEALTHGANPAKSRSSPARRRLSAGMGKAVARTPR